VKHAIQAVDGAGIVSREVPGKIESNRWYDIRIEVEGPQVRTFLDGSPLISYTDPVISRFALNAGIARSNRELIVKCINGEDEARTANVNLTSGDWEPTARAIVMTSGHVNDENTFESPRKIAPRSYTVRNVRSSFPLVVPARSVLILRLRRQP
jgi:alpha-L-arabinofuranosidase